MSSRNPSSLSQPSAEERMETPTQQPISRRSELDEVSLSFTQERLRLLDQWEPENPSYSYPLALYLSGPLDEPALQQVLDKVACRHAVLRASFPAVDGRLVSVVQPGKPFASSVAGTACRRSL